jgi:hypothetical protein
MTNKLSKNMHSYKFNQYKIKKFNFKFNTNLFSQNFSKKTVNVPSMGDSITEGTVFEL